MQVEPDHAVDIPAKLVFFCIQNFIIRHHQDDPFLPEAIFQPCKQHLFMLYMVDKLHDYGNTTAK